MVAYQPEMSDQGAKTLPTSELRYFDDYASKATSGFNVGIHCLRNLDEIVDYLGEKQAAHWRGVRTAARERKAIHRRKLNASQQARSGSAQCESLITPSSTTAQTGSPVDIEYGASTLQGVGMQFDNNASTLVLQSQVRGRYIPPRAQP